MRRVRDGERLERVLAKEKGVGESGLHSSGGVGPVWVRPVWSSQPLESILHS